MPGLPRALLVAVVLCAAVAACSTSPTHTSTPPAPVSLSSKTNICRYLNPAVVRSILGANPTSAPSSTNQVSDANCTANVSTDVLTVVAVSGQAAQQLAGSEASSAGATIPISGVGQRAWRDTDGRTVIAVDGDLGCEALDFTSVVPPSPAHQAALLGSICQTIFTSV